MRPGVGKGADQPDAVKWLGKSPTMISKRQRIQVQSPPAGRSYWIAITTTLLACGRNITSADTPGTPNSSATNATVLNKVVVVGKLDEAREQIVPGLGATAYLVTSEQIATLSQGGNASMNQVVLRMPGVAQDSYGQLHVRGEHSNLQYRINDVILPEGLSGFGQELDTRFVDSAQLITGALPAQFGFRTAGVVDIHTKTGAFANGGEAQIYGGSYGTIRPNFEYGGSEGKLSYFANGSYNHNEIGIENPTASSTPIHDATDQYKLFSYIAYVIDDSSRLSFMLSGSHSTFQIPNTPGLDPFGIVDSAKLDNNQIEQNYFGVAAYQKTIGELSLQVAAFGRNSGVHFKPDTAGDLYFDRVATDIDRAVYSGGFQADVSYNLGDQHTLRGGALFIGESSRANAITTVYNVNAAGNPVGSAFPVGTASNLSGQFYGLYLQDEWKLLPKVTINYGARFDVVSGFLNENQVSPRANVIYEISDQTTFHAGYSRYFTPPPLELVRSGDISRFVGTSNQADPGVTANDPIRSERAHYFDVGFTQKLVPGLQFGVDGYYKTARHQLDDGLFGKSLIQTPFNYDEGRIYGVELTTGYNHGGFSSFANVAVSKAQGRNWNSSQFLFSSADLTYSQNHWIGLDHDQLISGSFGAAYRIEESLGSTQLIVDALYGSGLRSDATAADGSNIPNGATVPAYYSINVGIEQSFKLTGKRFLKARLDVVNVTDQVYELRDGSGVGVNAAQFGMRRGFFGSLSYVF